MTLLTDDIGTIVARMRNDLAVEPVKDYLNTLGYTAMNMPYYEYGHRQDINLRLLEKDKDSVYKYQKYPLVALRLDVVEQISEGLIHYNLNIAILAFTDRNYTSVERTENVFKPILYPLYNNFLKHLRNSGIFTWPNYMTQPEHTKIDRYYWGTPGSEGNVKNIFSDPIDAIEIVDLKINKRIKC